MMYVKDTTIEVNWILPQTLVDIKVEDFVVTETAPNKCAVCKPRSTNLIRFNKPTHNTRGSITYLFTPREVGTWTVTLSTDAYAPDKVELPITLQVSVPDTHI